mmetsp:Transcript_44161/g.104534  ORF Transcript_44161/g.104534 Transcript_44161/m.104534 type:complete len:514 (-) Transcript_44161:262-1803(-)
MGAAHAHGDLPLHCYEGVYSSIGRRKLNMRQQPDRWGPPPRASFQTEVHTVSPSTSELHVSAPHLQRCVHLKVGAYVEVSAPPRLAALSLLRPHDGFASGSAECPSPLYRGAPLEAAENDDRPSPGKNRVWVPAKISSLRPGSVTVSIGTGNAEVRRMVTIEEIYCPRPRLKRLSAPPTSAAVAWPAPCQHLSWAAQLRKGDTVEVLSRRPTVEWVQGVVTSLTSSAVCVSFSRMGDECRKVVLRTSRDLRPAETPAPPSMPAEPGVSSDVVHMNNADKAASHRRLSCGSKGRRTSICPKSARRKSSKCGSTGQRGRRQSKAGRGRLQQPTCGNCGEEVSLATLLPGLRAEVYLIDDERSWAPAVVTKASNGVLRVGVSLANDAKAQVKWRSVLRENQSQPECGAKQIASSDVKGRGLDSIGQETVRWQPGDAAEVYSSRWQSWLPATVREVTSTEVHLKVKAHNGLWWMESCPLMSSDLRRARDAAMTCTPSSTSPRMSSKSSTGSSLELLF